MNIVFRVDASVEIGTGHVMRCLSLAEHLNAQGHATSFISRDFEGNLNDILRHEGRAVHPLPAPKHPIPKSSSVHKNWLGVSWEEDAAQTREILERFPETPDWLVTDHYALDQSWEDVVRPVIRRLMAIDDLANRPHRCDLLLDQNLYDDMHERYAPWLNGSTTCLLGPSYALLRPIFMKERSSLKRSISDVKQVVVMVGGSDPNNYTERVLESLAPLSKLLPRVVVVVGKGNPHKERIEARVRAMPNGTFYCQVEHMADLIRQSDIGIGGGGISIWERCCLGLPSLVLVASDHQAALIETAAKAGVLLNIGAAENLRVEVLRNAMHDLVNDRARRESLSQKSLELVDGQGALRVIGALAGNSNGRILHAVG